MPQLSNPDALETSVASRKRKATHENADIADSGESSQQEPPPSTSSSGSESQDVPKAATLCYCCQWKGCSDEFGDDAMSYFQHLQNHAYENLAGPCFWKDCVASASVRASRHQSRWMEHHMKTCHMPKKAFPCIMDGCNKRFDTPDCLESHINKHPQPKKPEKLENGVPEPRSDFLTESVLESIAFTRIYPNLQRSLKGHDALRPLGITYMALFDEYFVSVHGIPEGEVKIVPTGFERKYRLNYPFAPAWIKEVYVRCILDSSESHESLIVWKLPLSNPLFRDPLRFFVGETENQLIPPLVNCETGN